MSQLVQPSAAPVTGPEFDNRRILAAVIDLLLLVPMLLVLVALFGGVSAGVGALGAAWALFYYFALESDDGQTVGKRLMKLRVVRADGGHVDMGRVAVRTLLRPIDMICALGAMIATGRRRQRIGDLAAGTVVTDAGAPVISAAVEAPPAPAAEQPPSEVEGDTGLELEHVQPHDVELPKAPVDIGEALPSAGEDKPSSVPELTNFDPFAKAATEAEVAEPELEPEAEVEPEPEQPAVSLAGPLPPAGAAPEAEVAEEEPVAEEPVAEEPLVEEPVVEEPVVEEPVVEEPVAQEPEAQPAAEPAGAGFAELIQAVKEADEQTADATMPEPPPYVEPEVTDLPEPPALVEPEPVVEDEPEPVVEVVAEEPSADQEPSAEPKPRLEIISSAIDMVMADEEPQSPAEPEDEEPQAPAGG